MNGLESKIYDLAMEAKFTKNDQAYEAYMICLTLVEKDILEREETEAQIGREIVEVIKELYGEIKQTK